ncbi:hypothetical protein T281_13620 [Rhodomicrobium udaipurense JA643]|nr:hypothetical protein T281_13620 [Rhodomicrobium udaipurense JA643]
MDGVPPTSCFDRLPHRTLFDLRQAVERAAALVVHFGHARPPIGVAADRRAKYSDSASRASTIEPMRSAPDSPHPDPADLYRPP